MSDKDFLYPDHQMLFVLMKGILEKGANTIDLSMVIGQAQSSGVIDVIGGAPYVQSISNIEVSSDNFEKYIDLVLEASTKYRAYVKLQQHMEFIAQNAHEGKSSSELIGSIEADMLDMTVRSLANDDAVELSSTLDSFIEERRDRRIEMSGMSTGYTILDKQIDGMIPGTLMVIAARKKMGKSTFITNIGCHVAYNLEVPTLYIDTELSFSEWQTRALAKMSKVKERDVKQGGWSPQQLMAIEDAKRRMSRGKIFHKYMPGYSVEKVVALCKKYKIKENIGLIIFDYIKEPDLSSTDGSRKEHQLLGDITTKLKDLAGILDIPVLTAVQLNRANDIADSDRIARYGDIIAMWGPRTEDEKEMAGRSECGNYKIHIQDTRRGGSTCKEGIGYWFFKQYLDIKEVIPKHQYFIHNHIEESNNDDADEATFRLYNDKDAIT
jgi:replicative DNA helicase